MFCFFFRYFFHVHDCWAVHVEALSEETPRHQCKRLHCLRLLGYGHLLFRAGSGVYCTVHQFQVYSVILDMSVDGVCRCSVKETWFSGSFSQSSTFWPHSSSVHSSTTWADGGWVSNFGNPLFQSTNLLLKVKLHTVCCTFDTHTQLIIYLRLCQTLGCCAGLAMSFTQTASDSAADLCTLWVTTIKTWRNVGWKKRKTDDC